MKLTYLCGFPGRDLQQHGQAGKDGIVRQLDRTVRHALILTYLSG